MPNKAYSFFIHTQPQNMSFCKSHALKSFITNKFPLHVIIAALKVILHDINFCGIFLNRFKDFYIYLECAVLNQACS